MVYIDSSGRVLQSRPFGLGSIVEFFWGIFNFFALFFRTLLSPDSNKKGSSYTSDYRAPGRGGPGPPPGPRRRFGGFGGGGNSPSCPPMGGGG